MDRFRKALTGQLYFRRDFGTCTKTKNRQKKTAKKPGKDISRALRAAGPPVDSEEKSCPS